MEKFKRFDIQMFAEANMNVAADLTPGISIDFVSNFTSNITELLLLFLFGTSLLFHVK